MTDNAPTDIEMADAAPRVWEYLKCDASGTLRSMRRGCVNLLYGDATLPVHADALIDASRLVAGLFEADPDLTTIRIPETIPADALDMFLGACVYPPIPGSNRMFSAVRSSRVAAFFDAPPHATGRLDSLMGRALVYHRNSAGNTTGSRFIIPFFTVENFLDVLMSHKEEMATHFPHTWTTAKIFQFMTSQYVWRCPGVLAELNNLALVPGQSYGIPHADDIAGMQEKYAAMTKRELLSALHDNDLEPDASAWDGPRTSRPDLISLLVSGMCLRDIRDLFDRATDGQWDEFEALAVEIADVSVLEGAAPELVCLSWTGWITNPTNNQSMASALFAPPLANPLRAYMKTRFGIDAAVVYATPPQALAWRARLASLFMNVSPQLQDLVRA